MDLVISKGGNRFNYGRGLKSSGEIRKFSRTLVKGSVLAVFMTASLKY
jgi:hypothetical protein